MPTIDAITILVVDDHPLFRQGVVHSLVGEPDFRVVGETASGQDRPQTEIDDPAAR